MNPFLPQVSIVVLNYNGEDCLLACLRSLWNISYDNYSVLIVDNGSTDNSLEEAKKEFPAFAYLSLPKNRGFAGGMNEGIRVAEKEGAAWVWLLNNDAVVENDCLSLLMETATLNTRRIGALSPVIYESQTDKLWFGKGKIDFLRMRVVHEEPTAKETTETFYPSAFLTGCALLINAKVFEIIGTLDEAFFLYYEDADFCLRLKKAGWERLVVPAAKVFHAEKSRINPLKIYHLVFSGLLFFRKHASPTGRIYYWVYVTIRKIKNSIDIWRGRDEARSVRRAYDDFCHD